jgi:ribulose 1,5-bisphosphate synthetase/thiazole synthase
MRRRKFLSNLLLFGGSAALGVQCRRSSDTGDGTPGEALPGPRSTGTVREPQQEIPVVASADVLVIGAGPAGVAAAIAASRAGAGTCLVERYNHPGGLWTGGLVLPLLSTHALDKSNHFRQVIYGIGDEIARRLRESGMAIYEENPVIDPEAGKYVMDRMIRESGIRMLYHCWASNVIVEDSNIRAVILESKSGRVAVTSKVVIDCTGDGDILKLAGEDFNKMNYHIGLVHRLGNIDRIDRSREGFEELSVGGPTPIPGVNWVNMQGKQDQDGLDLFTLSGLQQEYRIQIWEQTEEIKSRPGYEDVFLLDTASQLGVRMSRILKGRYKLTLKDTMTYTAFDDSIGISGAWIDVMYNGRRVPVRERPLWQIPYRSLVPEKTGNLLVAGRCFCFERALVEDTRIIGTCLVTGHGAGVAAAVAASSGTAVQDADIGRIQNILLEQNALIAC